MKTLPLVTASAAILLSLVLAGCSAPSAESASKPTKEASSSGSAMDKQIDTVVNQAIKSQGEDFCTALPNIPDESLPATLDTIESSLTSSGQLSAAQSKDIAQRVLTGSTKEFCPDQTARIETALG